MLYNTIHHNIRNKSGLSLIDYCLLESIYKLSTSPKARYKGWCNASKKTFEYLATTRTVTTRLKELEANGWIQFKDKSRLLKRTTDKYYSNIVAYILGVKYLHPPREETSPNNKIDNNKEIEKPSKFEFLDITPKKKYHIEDKRPDKNQPFGVVTSSQTLRAFYEDDTTELRNLLKDCFDLDATHEEISDCINSFATIAVATEDEKYRNYKEITTIEQLKGKFLRWIPTHLKHMKLYPKQFKPKKVKRKHDYDLSKYYQANYLPKHFRKITANGQLKADLEQFSNEFENLLAISAKYPTNETFNPMLVFEVLHKPLGRFLHGSTPKRKEASLLRFMEKQSEYNQARGDVRKLLQKEREKQAL